MTNVPEKWIKAQDGSLINLNRVVSIGKDFQEATDNFDVLANTGGFAVENGDSVYDNELLAEGLTEGEADQLVDALARILCLRVFHVTPLLDAIRGTLPEAELEAVHAPAN